MKQFLLVSIILLLTIPAFGQYKIMVKVDQPPKLDADAGKDQSIEKGESVKIGGDPSATGGSSDYTYTWTPENGLNNENVANPTASPTDTTDYILTIKDDNQCSDGDTVTVNVKTPTSIDKMAADQFIIYPNPARDKLIIYFSKGMTGQFNINLVDIQSKLLISEIMNTREAGKIELSTAGLQPGIYFIRIYNEHIYKTKKIVITR